MRLSIERMRTLVLAAGVLLLVALVVSLALGKWRNPFNRRDIPQRLGLNIKSDSSGYTFEHAFGAHARYKIHAAKVLEYKQGYAKLHDVTIEMYGDDGRSIDRIVGADFEYDQKAGTAKADGPVEITLERPGAVTTLSPKAVPSPALDPKLKGTPVGAAAETASRGEIHVKTSGLTFDRNTGVATTVQHVDFSMVQGSGSSIGATFDSQKGFVVLDRAVELSTKRGASTVQIRAQHVEFERASQLCRLHATAANYQGGQATAGDAKILFREDGSVVRLDAANGFTLATATGSHLAAPTGQLDFDEQNKLHHGHLEGGVTMDSASQKGSLSRQMHGVSPTAELDFTSLGQLRHAHLERGVELHSNELTAQTGQVQRTSRTWRSPVADINFRVVAHGHLEPASMHGSGGVVITGETQRGKGPVAPSHFAASDMTGDFASGSVLTAIHGTGNTAFEETTVAGVRQSTSGDRIEVRLAPASATKTDKEGEVQSATVEGHVVLVQLPAPSPRTGVQATPMRATAGRADYAGSGQWLHLTLNPRVENRGMQLTADKVDVSQSTSEAFAHGNVKASYLGTDSAHPGQGGAALGGQGPVHVIASEAQILQSTQEATFRGQARLWQQGNSISAPVIILDHIRQSLAAHTTTTSEPVRAVLVSAAAAAPAKEGSQPANKKEAAPSVIRVRGGDFRYSDMDRKALMRAGPLGSVLAETASASSTSNEVEVVLLPAGHHPGQDASQTQIDHMTARGRVLLTSAGRRGTGEQLVYTAATGEYVLTGTATELPRMTDPTRGVVTGQMLIFRSRDDSISVEGGSQKTRTQTTAPKR